MKRKRAFARNRRLLCEGRWQQRLRPMRPYRLFLERPRSSSSSYDPGEDSVQVLGFGRLKEVGELGKRSIQGFLEHRMMTYAAALAYQGLFALFPFIIFLGVLLVALQIHDFFDWLTEQARSQPPQQVSGPLGPLVEQVRSSLPKDMLAPVEGLVEQGKEVAANKLLPFGIVFFALWSASGGALTLIDTLNIVNQVEETRPLWKRLALSILCTPAFAVMAIVGVGLLLIWPQLAQWFAGWIGLSEAFVTFWAWLRIPVALLLLLLVVLFVYRFAPDRDRQVRFVMPGALLAVILWAAASVGFSFYLSNFANYSVVYGSLGTAIALLSYLYLSAVALLLGEEVNAAIYRSATDSEMQNQKLGINQETPASEKGSVRDV